MAPICTPLNRELGFAWLAKVPAKLAGAREIPAAANVAELINFLRENSFFEFEV
jgi:hypothetical protein